MTLTVYVPCDSTACSLGADDVATALQTAATAKACDIKLVRNGTRGLFWLEPLVEIEHDSQRYAFGPVQESDVGGLIDALTSGDMSAHAKALGPTEDIPYLKNQERLTFARLGIINPVDIDDYIAHGGYDGLKAALDITPQAIVDEVKTLGLRGRGGAAFPTGIKWQTVLDTDADQKYIVCNADEGDSGTFADRLLMEGDPFSLIEGMTIASRAVGATRGYIYLRCEYPDAHRMLDTAIKAATARGYLGENICGSGSDFFLSVRLGAGAYICGEETSLLESLEGKRCMVRAKPPLPAIEGLFGKPTIVNNVLTLGTIPLILAKGGAYYESYGEGRSRGTQPFQLAGNLKHGGLVEKAFGVTLQTLLQDFGGGTITGLPLKAVQCGGPLGAYIPGDKDVAMDYETLAAQGAMLGHGGIVAFDENAALGKLARFAMEFCTVESCGKCTPCRIGSTRGVEVIDRILAGQETASNLALLDDLCDIMKDGSLCAMGGLTPLPVTSIRTHFPNELGDN